MPLLSSLFKTVVLASLLCIPIINSNAQQPTPTEPVSRATTAAPGNTVADLQMRISQRLADPAVRRGNIGVKVVSLRSGTTVFEQNAEKYFMPASNMKNFTVAAALERLTPDHRFTTTAFASERPTTDGTLKGDLYIRGTGDVSISYSFNDGDNFKGIDRLVDAIAAAGVKRMEGNVVGDDSYFRGSPIPTGWEWDDLQWYYGAEVSALPINDNAIALSVAPGQVGSVCPAKVVPFNFVIRVQNRCITTAAGTPRTLRIEKKIGQNLIEISGELPEGNSGFNGNVTVSRPAEHFASMLKQRLAEKGITVTGQSRAITPGIPANGAPMTEIAKIDSVPLSLIAAKTMKPSQNMFTETLLWTLGEQLRAKNGTASANLAARSSAELGITAVKEFLKEIGIADDAVLQHDGSGLSRHNLVTPTAVTHLYVHMSKNSRFSRAWRDSLTIGGVDGTLRNRFTGTRGEGNVRGKTGTINQVSALSGYVTTAGGEELVFSVLVNGVPQTGTRVGLIDEIVLMLANFHGKIEN